MGESAERVVELNNPGAYIGPYRTSVTPYMVEPMSVLTSLEYQACVFCGPAQSGKTESLILNWIAHNATTDPLDISVYSPTQGAARDFSIRRVNRLHMHSKKVGSMLLSNDTDNIHDKQYRNGMMLSLSWPTIAELRGKPIPNVALTDYDAFDLDIEGEGNAFDLATKRTTTFDSYGMTLAESSPGFGIKNPKWYPRTPHEAPPTDGVLSLYNRGDRRRWVWPCASCGEFFEGDWEHLKYETQPGMSSLESAETVYMQCPVCAQRIEQASRAGMMQRGVWIKEGQSVDRDGRVQGAGLRSEIASFWLKGTSAAFQPWSGLVRNYLDAMGEKERTGDEGSVRKMFNTDLARIYISDSLKSDRLPEKLMERARDVGSKSNPVVPGDVRCLIACVDVQKNAYVVQVHGIRPGTPYDVFVVDRFTITKSYRTDHEDEHLYVKPDSYAEDWNVLIDEVMDRTYPLADDSGRRMMVKMTICDSGGAGSKRHRVSATSNAYLFYRKLVKEGRSARFHLVKGVGNPDAPRTHISYPDAQKKDAFAAARGDVPVMLMNSNSLKTTLSGRLESVSPGTGMWSFPRWLEEWFYEELCVEVNEQGKWVNRADARNEAWDLAYYLIGVCSNPILGIETADWLNPPGWLAEWDRNTLVLAPEQDKKFDPRPKADYDFSAFGSRMA